VASANAVEQTGDRNVEATSKTHENADAWVTLGALDATHVRQREPGRMSKLLLRHAPRVTAGTDVRTEPTQRVTSHSRIVVQ